MTVIFSDSCAIPENFGAGGTGATDDTVALQAALNSGRPQLYLPGTYSCSALTIPTSVQKVFGPGTLIAFGTLALNSSFLTVVDRGSALLKLFEFGVVLNSTNYPTVWALKVGSSKVDIDRLNFGPCGNSAIVFTGGSVGSSIRNCQIFGAIGHTLDIVGANVLWIEGNTITAGSIIGHTINLNTGNDIVVRGNSIYGGPGGFGLYAFNVQRASINGSWRNSAHEAIVIDSCTDVSVETGTKLYWDSGVSQDFAISVGGQNATNLLQKNISFRGVSIRNCGKSGIFVGANSNGTRIDGGTIIDANSLGAGNPTPAYSDGVTIGGMGGESSIINTRVDGLVVQNTVSPRAVHAVHEQIGAGGTPDFTSVVHAAAIGLSGSATVLTGPHSTVV